MKWTTNYKRNIDVQCRTLRRQQIGVNTQAFPFASSVYVLAIVAGDDVPLLHPEITNKYEKYLNI